METVSVISDYDAFVLGRVVLKIFFIMNLNALRSATRTTSFSFVLSLSRLHVR